MKCLERHGHVEEAVLDLVNRAHAATPEERSHQVASGYHVAWLQVLDRSGLLEILIERGRDMADSRQVLGGMRLDRVVRLE